MQSYYESHLMSWDPFVDSQGQYCDRFYVDLVQKTWNHYTEGYL